MKDSADFGIWAEEQWVMLEVQGVRWVISNSRRVPNQPPELFLLRPHSREDPAGRTVKEKINDNYSDTLDNQDCCPVGRKWFCFPTHAVSVSEN